MGRGTLSFKEPIKLGALTYSSSIDDTGDIFYLAPIGVYDYQACFTLRESANENFTFEIEGEFHIVTEDKFKVAASAERSFFEQVYGQLIYLFQTSEGERLRDTERIKDLLHAAFGKHAKKVFYDEKRGYAYIV